MRNYNTPRLDFFDDLFQKNQSSALPAKRADFYNIAQEIWAEIENLFDKEGVEKVLELMGSRYRKTKKTSYGKARQYNELDFNIQNVNKRRMTNHRTPQEDLVSEYLGDIES